MCFFLCWLFWIETYANLFLLFLDLTIACCNNFLRIRTSPTSPKKSPVIFFRDHSAPGSRSSSPSRAKRWFGTGDFICPAFCVRSRLTQRPSRWNLTIFDDFCIFLLPLECFASSFANTFQFHRTVEVQEKTWKITSLRVIPTVTSYWHIFVTNPDILCAKIWRLDTPRRLETKIWKI